MKKRVIIFFTYATAGLIFFLFSSGCTMVNVGFASLRSTADFVPLKNEPRVLAEPGGEDIAAMVAEQLPEAIATVEREQYAPFAQPVQVYVTADEESLARHAGVSKKVRGVVTNKVFISGGIRQEPERIRAIVTHELSHRHLQQRLGIIGFNTHLPAWFQEGLAVMVSGGGGAEKTSEAEAVAAIRNGKALKPDDSGSFLFHRSAHSYCLEPHMFYRQSCMFVAYLKGLDETKFRTLLLTIEGGTPFAEAFPATYRTTLDAVWQQFREKAEGDNRRVRPTQLTNVKCVGLNPCDVFLCAPGI